MANVYTNDLVFISVLLAFIYLNKVVSTTQRKKKREKKTRRRNFMSSFIVWTNIYILMGHRHDMSK